MLVQDDDPDYPWFAPGVYRITPTLFRVPLPLTRHDALKAVNAYVILSEARVTVIDAGQALEESRGLLDEALAALGTHVSEVDDFLVTHYHRDHYTMALALRREYGLTISLGYGEADSLAYHRSEGDLAGGLQPQLDLLAKCGAHDLLEAFADGLPRADGYGLGEALPAATWQDPDRWLTDGMPLPLADRILEAVATPGHTFGHVAFHDLDNAQLFAGDHVLPHITPSIGFEGHPRPFPLRDYISSLRKVRDRPDAALLPAHGPLATSVHSRVDELLAHHEQRLDVVQALLGTGLDTAAAIAERMTWTRKERSLGELDPVNSMMAILETKAHLDVLVLRGSASSALDGAIQRYVTA
jgi:glyoxylase-like metal-dependent hydrolase (beta-lactamase superfamily II)